MSSRSNKVIIRKASIEEQVSILSEPRLLAVLPDSPKVSELEQYIIAKQFDYWLLTFGKYKMLFECYPYSRQEGVREFHAICPKDSIKASRALILLSLKFVFEQWPDTRALICKCLEGKIANLCKKVGAVKVGSEGDYVVMFATKEQLGIA